MLYSLIIFLSVNFNTGEQAFDHDFENKRVHIKFSKVERDSKRVIVGSVEDKKSGKGFPGMHIYFKKKDYGIISDAKGNFEIKVPTNKTRLVFSFLRRNKVIINLDDY